MGSIHNEYKSSGEWERELFIESNSFAASAITGTTVVNAGAAALAILVMATPIGWVGLENNSMPVRNVFSRRQSNFSENLNSKLAKYRSSNSMYHHRSSLYRYCFLYRLILRLLRSILLTLLFDIYCLLQRIALTFIGFFKLRIFKVICPF